MNTKILGNCIQCGRCSGGCPVAMKSKLNIRKILYSFLLTNSLPSDAGKIGIWECTTCSTCNQRCPKSCEPLNLLLETRANFVEKGRIEASLVKALENTLLHGNPFGKPKEKRTDWLKKIDFPVRVLQKGESADYLLFICCINAYDPRMQEVARSVAKILSALKIDFGILGEEENCCGSEIKRMGETGLFNELKEKNSQAMAGIKIKGIITISPHCYNALKSEYELALPVSHYTTFLLNEKEKWQNRINRTEEIGLFHDPCFLGKMNKIYDPPRELLKTILKELKEFDRTRENSLCCEGGGGRMWMESESKERLAEKRVDSALKMGINKIFTACPFCLSTLEDAVKVKGKEEEMKILDITEFFAQNLKIET
ncbi:MAG: (Fe-S)-binding protein [candidate division WOR-3 bacterium]